DRRAMSHVFEEDVAKVEGHLDLADTLVSLRVGDLEAGAGEVDLPNEQSAQLADAKTAEPEPRDDGAPTAKRGWLVACEVVADGLRRAIDLGCDLGGGHAPRFHGADVGADAVTWLAVELAGRIEQRL